MARGRVPGPPPIDTDYPPANGEKNGIKKQLEDAADAQRVLLFPVFDTATRASRLPRHRLGRIRHRRGRQVDRQRTNHVLTGHFVTFIATDLAAGNPLTDPDNDFGVHVITLTK